MVMQMATASESSTKWRIGLLVSTLTLGVGLAVTGISGYLQAKQSSRILTQSEVMAIGHGLRREIARYRGDINEAVAAYMSDSEDQGLNYLALLDQHGMTVKRFGHQRFDFSEAFLASIATTIHWFPNRSAP